MTAIAHQCFNTEYVFEETEAERAQLAALRDRILAAASVSEHWCAAYAAYRPLHYVAGQDLPDRLARAPADPRARRGTPPRRGDSLFERRAKRGVGQSAGAIRSEPIPALAARAGGRRSGAPENFREAAHPGGGLRHRPARDCDRAALSGGERAGGGPQPGEPGLCAAQDARARPRPTSSTGRRTSWRSTGCAERFDLIECSGVLHHLEDPFEGWRVLEKSAQARRAFDARGPLQRERTPGRGARARADRRRRLCAGRRGNPRLPGRDPRPFRGRAARQHSRATRTSTA